MIGNYSKEHLDWLEKQVQAGKSEAQCTLGKYYVLGEGGIEQDYNKAFELFSKAAKQGNSTAMYHLGVMYYNGTGVEKDAVKAADYFRQNIDAPDYGFSFTSIIGYTEALANLGLMYYDGIGVDVDLQKARELLEKAEKRGDGKAMYALGIMYHYGNGVEVDLNRAAGLYRGAYLKGIFKAEERLKEIKADTT